VIEVFEKARCGRRVFGLWGFCVLGLEGLWEVWPWEGCVSFRRCLSWGGCVFKRQGVLGDRGELFFWPKRILVCGGAFFFG